MFKPLVSILIPAYNAEETISETIQSAIAQTWPRKEIIVVDDGSTDLTAQTARRFGSKVAVVSTGNCGGQSARNLAFSLSQGDYIQWLDADDLLTADKIERQLAALRRGDSRRVLLSSSWAKFYYRKRHVHFVRNPLCEDLSPVEWLLRKMSGNYFMQTATWLMSRELAESAGAWDSLLETDQDGEYFARVLMASEGTRFVHGVGVFYRISGSRRVSFAGGSNKKKDSRLRAIKLQIQYLRSLEESERVRKACIKYLQDWYLTFYPERMDLVAEMQDLAADLQGQLEEPRLRWKYDWMRPVFGWKTAKSAQIMLPELKASCVRRFDRTMYRLREKGPENLSLPTLETQAADMLQGTPPSTPLERE